MAPRIGLLTLLALVSVQAKVPVIFAPGYGGSDIYLTFDSEQSIPAACAGLDLPVGKPFLAIPSKNGISSNSKCLKVVFSVPAPAGVVASVTDFGGYRGISSAYWGVLNTFKAWGYELGRNFFGSPYDYRFMTKDGLKASGFSSAMQSLVEKAYTLNGNTKVVIIGHSNGPPTQYAFLASMSAEWKAKHVQAMIGLSGNYLGQMNAYSSLFYNDDTDRQDMEATWDATYLSCPWGGYAGLAGVTLVTTQYQTEQERNYTALVQDVTSLFGSVGKDDWSYALRAYYFEMDRSAPPMVDTFCLYGSGVQTAFSYAFSGTILEAAPTLTRTMDGDDNQDIFDNAFCKVWDAGLTAAGYRFEAQAFPGVHHMQMVSDEAVLARVKVILDSY